MTKQEIAKYLDDAAYSATPVQQVAKKNEVDLNTAYAIQGLSIDERLKRGEKITGYKLGFTSYAKMEQMGVHDLIWGVLTDKMRISPDDQIDLDRYIHPRAEPEIAFRVLREIDRPLELEDLPQYLDKMAVAVEVIDSRYENFKFTLEDVVADNCSSSGYVIGSWKDLDTEISDRAIHLKIDDEIVQKGKLKAILKNPLQSVVELSRLAANAQVPIRKGQVIMAGAATAAVYLKPGQTVEANLEDIGKVGFTTK